MNSATSPNGIERVEMVDAADCALGLVVEPDSDPLAVRLLVDVEPGRVGERLGDHAAFVFDERLGLVGGGDDRDASTGMRHVCDLGGSALDRASRGRGLERVVVAGGATVDDACRGAVLEAEAAAEMVEGAGE